MTTGKFCVNFSKWLILFTVLAGCSTFSGAPPPPADVKSQVDSLAVEHNAEAIIKCIETPSAQQTNCRDQIVQARLITIDVQYTQFRQRFYAEARWGGFAATVASLGLTTTASLSGIAPATGRTLSAIATGVTGTRAAFEKDILIERTANAIEFAMDASRNIVAARIRSGMKLPVQDYPLAVALSDLES